MKMILAGDTALYGPTDYSNFIYNCNLNQCQHKYTVPIPDLSKMQFFVYFGQTKPATMEFKLVSTCGNTCSYYEVTNNNPDATVFPWRTCTGFFVGSLFAAGQTITLYAMTGTVFASPGFTINNLGNSENIIAQDYVVGQLPNGLWYGVFKNFTTPVELVPSCFVMSAMFTFGSEEDPDYSELRYFSEEICIENCGELMEIKACFPEKATSLGFDMNRIYYGFHNGDVADALGDIAVRYFHKYYVRQSYIINTGKKTTFKTYLSRNFRTAIELLYQIRTELVPEWYADYLLAAFARGEIIVRETLSLAAKKWTLSETNFELIDEDAKLWKPVVTMLETIKQFFGCDECINGEQACLGNPTIYIRTHINPTEYTYSFLDGSVGAGESIQYELRNKVTGVLIASGYIGALPGGFAVKNALVDFDANCYTLRWRKVCATDAGSFSFDFSDDFEVGGAAGAFSEWITKEEGNCVTTPPVEVTCKQHQIQVFGSDGENWSVEAVLCDGSSYGYSGLVGDGNPPPLCAKEGTVSVFGNATITDSSADCPTGGCFTYKIVAPSSTGGGYNFTRCDGTLGDGLMAADDVVFVCARMGTVVTSDPGFVVTRLDPCIG